MKSAPTIAMIQVALKAARATRAKDLQSIHVARARALYATLREQLIGVCEDLETLEREIAIPTPAQPPLPILGVDR